MGAVEIGCAVFWHKRHWFRLPFMRGAKYRRGIKISEFSTNKSLYLVDDKQDIAIVTMEGE